MKIIEELEAALAAATPGEWHDDGVGRVFSSEFRLLAYCDKDATKNAELIALVHNALPALIECAEALNAIYNRIPTSAIPNEFIGGEGNWGLTEEENALAVIAATALAKLEKQA